MSWNRFLLLNPGTKLVMLLLGLCCFSAFRTRHDFHNSLTEMRYNAKNKAFEIEIKLFTDDLEKALSQPGKKIRIQDKDQNDKLIEAYIRKHFKVSTATGTAKPYQYVGKQNELDATWVFIEMPFSESIQGVKLQQSALTDVFDDQQNIVNLTYGADKKYYLFNEKVPIRVIE